MKIRYNKKDRVYTTPEIEVITLDNEISLSMESDPAEGPGESYIPENKVMDPFKDQMA